MFKGASEKQNYISRVASHATKGRANGLVTLLPRESAKEQTYQEAKAQYEAINKIVDAARERWLSATSEQKKRILKREYDDLCQTRASYAESARALSLDSYATVFMRIAELKLHKDIFKEIDIETESVIGRRAQEIRQRPGSYQKAKRDRSRVS